MPPALSAGPVARPQRACGGLVRSRRRACSLPRRRRGRPEMSGKTEIRVAFRRGRRAEERCVNNHRRRALWAAVGRGGEAMRQEPSATRTLGGLWERRRTNKEAGVVWGACLFVCLCLLVRERRGLSAGLFGQRADLDLDLDLDLDPGQPLKQTNKQTAGTGPLLRCLCVFVCLSACSFGRGEGGRPALDCRHRTSQPVNQSTCQPASQGPCALRRPPPRVGRNNTLTACAAAAGQKWVAIRRHGRPSGSRETRFSPPKNAFLGRPEN